MPNAYFVSDLHLYSRRSTGLEYCAQVADTASLADLFVFGGDIFDFRWTTLDSIADTVCQAADWLTDLSVECPDCRFHFVLGNHDYHRLFIERLGEICHATNSGDRRQS